MATFEGVDGLAKACRRAYGSAALMFYCDREASAPSDNSGVVTRVPVDGKNGVKPWTVTDITRDATITRRPK